MMNFEIKICAERSGDFIQLNIQDDKDKMVGVALVDVDYKKAIQRAEVIFIAMTKLNESLKED